MLEYRGPGRTQRPVSAAAANVEPWPTILRSASRSPVHRQSNLAAHVPGGRARSIAARLERRGVAATYALHDRALANRAARRRFDAAAAPLDDLQRGLIADLDENGFAIVPFADLVADADLVRAVEEQGAAFISRTETALANGGAGASDELRRRPGKEFVVRALSFEGVQLGLDDPWFRACLSTRLLDLANAYLRMWAKLSYVDLWYTVPQADGCGARRIAALASRLRRQAPAQGVPLPERRRRRSRAVRVRPRQPGAGPLRLDLALVAAALRPDPRRAGPAPCRSGRDQDLHRPARDRHPLQHERAPPRRLQHREAARARDGDVLLACIAPRPQPPELRAGAPDARPRMSAPARFAVS